MPCFWSYFSSFFSGSFVPILVFMVHCDWESDTFILFLQISVVAPFFFFFFTPYRLPSGQIYMTSPFVSLKIFDLL